MILLQYTWQVDNILDLYAEGIWFEFLLQFYERFSTSLGKCWNRILKWVIIICLPFIVFLTHSTLHAPLIETVLLKDEGIY